MIDNGSPLIAATPSLARWTAELHGVGDASMAVQMMHGTRLVHIGFADVAFVLWRAEQDMKSS